MHFGKEKNRLAVYKHFWSPILSSVSRCDILDFVIIFLLQWVHEWQTKVPRYNQGPRVSIYFVLVHVGLYLDGHLVPWQPVHLCLCWTMEVARFCHWRNVGIFDLCECGPIALIFVPLFHFRIAPLSFCSWYILLLYTNSKIPLHWNLGTRFFLKGVGCDSSGF